MSETATTTKKRGPRSKKMLGVFIDGGKPVKAMFLIRDKEIQFRKKGSRKVCKISLREIYDKITGQIVMPFV